MQQILNFSIEIFDIRTRLSMKIKDDSNLVRGIQVRKNTSLDNSATISFAKDRSYVLLGLEEQLKLYNYVKIKLTLKNYDIENTITDFYFSGFIQTVNKNVVYGTTPSAQVSITIVDFANLFKTTFYTKNLTFVQILQEAVPEFRLINLAEVFNDPQNKILNNFYSINQIGFIFFAFFFFKFLYSIVYDKPGESKKSGNESIFKEFKIFMPFGFDLINNKSVKIESMFKSQVSSLIIYKQLQGVALDLFKYIYPEPIFEFTTHETEKSVILQIRLTPLMSFSRPRVDPVSLKYGPKVGLAEDAGEDLYSSRQILLEGSISGVDTYKVIDEEDFGHLRIRKMSSETGLSVSNQIREHLKSITKLLNDTLKQSKKLDVDSLLPDNKENDELIAAYFNEIPMDIRFIETMNMTRSAQNVVNVVWTVPTTDTAVLQSSGRSLVYGLLQQKLKEIGGGSDQFANYIAEQYVKNKQPNPVFFWNYRDMYSDKYVSGDMNYFGFREFEIKWNCLTVYDSTVYHVLNFIDRSLLDKIIEENKLDDSLTKFISAALEKNQQLIDTPPVSKNGKNPKNQAPKIKKIGLFYENAFNNDDFRSSIYRLGFTEEDIKKMKTQDLVSFIQNVKKVGSGKIGDFAAKLNGIISKAYRENEHLYDCQLTMPINLSILPGMIVKSEYPNNETFNSPKFKGYVTAISHTIDFNSASMKSAFTINRTALEDSGLVVNKHG
jgi:hypothetical protein